MRELNFPSNYLASRLGSTNSWGSDFSPHRLNFQTSLLPQTAGIFIRLFFKNGLIFLAHPFKSTLNSTLRGFMPLPKFLTVEDMYKFYRLHRVKATIFSTYKTTFILRKFFRKLASPTFYLYTLHNFLLIQGIIHIPENFKSPRAQSLVSDSIWAKGSRRFRRAQARSLSFLSFFQATFFLRKLIAFFCLIFLHFFILTIGWLS